MSVYIDDVAERIRQLAAPDSARTGEDIALYRLYAVLLLAKGENVTTADVHNAWAAWAAEHEPSNCNLLPFEHLSTQVQRKDLPYLAAIHRVARNGLGPQEES